MISTRLSAQCTDARVNIVTEVLFEKYPTLESLAHAEYDDIEQIDVYKRQAFRSPGVQNGGSLLL